MLGVRRRAEGARHNGEEMSLFPDSDSRRNDVGENIADPEAA